MHRVLPAALLAAAAVMASDHAVARPHAPPTPWKDPAGPPTKVDVWLARLVGRYRIEGLVEVVYDYEGYPEHRCAPLPPDPAQQENPPPPPVPYCSSITGMGDCVGIGSGPGVQCVLNVTWRDIHEVTPEGIYNLPGGVSYLAPAMLLFGLDPGQSAINYLLVDNKGLPEGGPGITGGSRTTFRTPCVNASSLFQAMKPPPSPPATPNFRTAPRSCERSIRIDARPDARVLHVAIDIEINGDLWTRYELSLRRVAQVATGPASGGTPASR